MALLRNDALINHPYLRRYPTDQKSWSDFIRALNQQQVDSQGAVSGAIELVDSLPTLPSDDYPEGAVVFLTTDDKLYRNTDGSTWSAAVDGGDITANTIVGDAIIAGQITAAKLASTLTFTNSLVISSGGEIRQGQTNYDTGSGFWLGDDAGTAKLSIGNSAGNKVTWDGSTLTVVGTVSGSFPATDLTGTVDLGSQISGTLTEAFADAGLINSNVTINADGSLTGAGGGQASLTQLPGTVAAGQIAANAVTTEKLNALAVTAAKIASSTITADKLAATLTFTNTLILDTNGKLYTSGKTDFSDTTAGIFLGYDASEADYVFNIGDASNYVQWDGSTLSVLGDVKFGSVLTFTPVWSGFSIDPTGDMNYLDLGTHAMIWVGDTDFAGLSDSTAMALSGVPASIRPSEDISIGICLVIDGTQGGSQLAWATLTTAGVMFFNRVTSGSTYAAVGTNTFTSSGAKGLHGGTVFIYPK